MRRLFINGEDQQNWTRKCHWLSFLLYVVGANAPLAANLPLPEMRVDISPRQLDCYSPFVCHWPDSLFLHSAMKTALRKQRYRQWKQQALVIVTASSWEWACELHGSRDMLVLPTPVSQDMEHIPARAGQQSGNICWMNKMKSKALKAGSRKELYLRPAVLTQLSNTSHWTKMQHTALPSCWILSTEFK